MALETTKTTYLNGSSKDGNRVLANFSSSLSESGTMTINETISDNANLDTLDTVEADFNEFRELAKNELKKLNGQDTETDVSSDKPVDDKPADTTKVDDKPETVVKDDKPVDITTKTDDKSDTDVSSDKTGNPEVASTTTDNEAVKDSEPADAVAKADDKPYAGTPDETKVSDVKDGETKQPIPSEETKQPVASEEVKQPISSEGIKQPVSSEEINQPVPSEGIKQPASSEEVKDSEPVGTSIKTDDKPETGTPKEVKASDVKDGENADESN